MSAHHNSSEWHRTIRIMRPRLEAQVRAGTARCVDCGRPVVDGERWVVGHIVSVKEGKARGWTVQQINAPTNLGPSHSKTGTKGTAVKACNDIAGGRLGARAKTTKAAQQQRRPDWRTW